jgi:hypothetical protein
MTYEELEAWAAHNNAAFQISRRRWKGSKDWQTEVFVTIHKETELPDYRQHFGHAVADTLAAAILSAMAAYVHSFEFKPYVFAAPAKRTITLDDLEL